QIHLSFHSIDLQRVPSCIHAQGMAPSRDVLRTRVDRVVEVLRVDMAAAPPQGGWRAWRLALPRCSRDGVQSREHCPQRRPTCRQLFARAKTCTSTPARDPCGDPYLES